MHTKLTMRYPTAWHREMWREGAPFGNGLVGGLVYGGIWKEYILINHAKLWRGGKNDTLPDVHEKLADARWFLDRNDPEAADRVLPDAIRSSGYEGGISYPLPLCDIRVDTISRAPHRDYRREIFMDRGLVRVSWREGDVKYTREIFASRADRRVYFRYRAENGRIDTSLFLDVHDTETLGNVKPNRVESSARASFLYFAAGNDSTYNPGDYGAAARVMTDGVTRTNQNRLEVSGATEIVLVLDTFVGMPREKAFGKLTGSLLDDIPRFDDALDENMKIHGELMSRNEFSISDTDSDSANEDLLADAFGGNVSNELIEKLYAYGRYLFICSTDAKDTLPCSLTGLFSGTYQSFWAFYMYNINFEMIYWQALNGGLPEFLRLALDYTESFMDDFRENARKLFGCRGIWINSVNTPESGLCKNLARHIVNWTGGAAWFGQHFWDYWRFTGDEKYLREHVLPYLYEVALFYEDFAVTAEDGMYDLYPSVSPENTPANVWEKYHREIETAKNAAMEFALMKETLTHLIEGAELCGMYAEKIPVWKEMLKKIRPYRINSDGAIAEWLDPSYEDRYNHRHHSHMYPVFPGDEITPDDELYGAFVRAEELRINGGKPGTLAGIFQHSSWGMINMVGEAARLERPETALGALEETARSCALENFLTVHNDWRHMGPICCDDNRTAPFQIDANCGIPAVVNEMLVGSRDEYITIFPALPDKWERGSVRGIHTRGGIVFDIEWRSGEAELTLRAPTPTERRIRLGSGFAFEDGTKEKRFAAAGETRIHIAKKSGEA